MCNRICVCDDMGEQKMKEAIIRLKSDHSKVKGAEYVRDYQHGEWIRDRYWSRGVGMGEEYGFFYKCSLCEYEVENGYTRCGFNFCPYCGADMREVRDE